MKVKILECERADQKKKQKNFLLISEIQHLKTLEYNGLKANMIMVKNIHIFYIHMHIQISWMADR